MFLSAPIQKLLSFVPGFHRSLRWRIQLWHALVLLVVIVVFGLVTYTVLRSARMREIDSELVAAVQLLSVQVQDLADDASTSDVTSGKSAQHENAFPAEIASGLTVPNTFDSRPARYRFELPYFVIVGHAGDVIETSAIDFSRKPPALRSLPSNASDDIQFRNRQEWREAYVREPGGHTIIVGRFLAAEYNYLRSVAWTLASVGLGLLLMGWCGGLIVAARAIAPIERISALVAQTDANSLSQRVDIQLMDREIAKLGEALNDAFERLEDSFERQARFTADASHELRTPLAVLQMHQQLALSKPRSVDEYRSTIETCSQATNRMSELAEQLLTLARLDQAVGSVRQTVCLRKIIEASLNRIRPVADQQQIKLAAMDCDVAQATVRGNEAELTRVFANLLANAIAHSVSGDEVSIRLVERSCEWIVSVVDTGCGMSPQHLDKIFDRFYRVDQTRGRASEGGSGLGLSICKEIVESHGGTISVESEPGHGSQFIVRLAADAPEASRPAKVSPASGGHL